METDRFIHNISSSDCEDGKQDYVPLYKRLCPDAGDGCKSSEDVSSVNFSDDVNSELLSGVERRAAPRSPPSADAAVAAPARADSPTYIDRARYNSRPSATAAAALLSAGGVTSDNARAAQKAREKQCRQEMRNRREQEKQRRRAEAVAKRQQRPEHCQKSLHVLLDARLLELAGAAELMTPLQASDVSVHVTTAADDAPAAAAAATAAPTLPVIRWERDVAESRDGQLVSSRQRADQLVAVASAATAASLMARQVAGAAPSLSGAVRAVQRRYAGARVTLLCWGLQKHCKTKTMAGCYRSSDNSGSQQQQQRGRKRTVSVSRLELEAATVDTLLDTGCNLQFVDSPLDGGLYLAQMSKAIAEAPFKLSRQVSAFGWLCSAGGGGGAAAAEAAPVKVDRRQRGLRRLWTQQLRHLPAGSLETAQAIAAAYPSPHALLQAYGGCASEAARRALVADLTIRRSVGPLVSTRRVGPETSRRLHLLMTAEQPAAPL